MFTRAVSKAARRAVRAIHQFAVMNGFAEYVKSPELNVPNARTNVFFL
jgi:hypothetical protein